MRIGILDHASAHLGGSQLVVARMAAQLSRAHRVEILHSGNSYTVELLGKAFQVDLSDVGERFVPANLGFQQTIRAYWRKGFGAERDLTRPYDLFIYSGHGVPPFSCASMGLVYCHFPFEASPARQFCNGARWQASHSVGNTLRRGIYQVLWRQRMKRYQGVLANSRFTAEWIERLWGARAEVLYPPVTIRAPALGKRNAIVTIGRFIGTDRKNHAKQLRAFARFLSQCSDSWSLTLVGFCGDHREDLAYLSKLQREAARLPVRFVVNADRDEVEQCMSEAKLFWHTTGLGEQENLAPRYYEHFGIATVEAMMAGCVPVVPARGGQLEIVDDERTGFLCHDLDALVGRSVELAKDDARRTELSRSAKAASQRFAPAAFERRLEELVDGGFEQARP